MLRLNCTKFDFSWSSTLPKTVLGSLQHSPSPI